MADSEVPDTTMTAVADADETGDLETMGTREPDPAATLKNLPPVPGPANPSPDGSTLAYLIEESWGQFRLELCPIAGGPPRTLGLPLAPHPDLPPDGEPGTDSGPQWSPDGTHLALLGPHPGGGRSAIWIVDVASGEGHLLADHPAADRGPRWSPDGELMAFTSARDGRDIVCIAPADGTGPVMALTDGRQDDRDPAWSHDGTMVAFRRRAGEAFHHHDLWLVVLATGEHRQLTGKPGKSGLGGKPANRWGMQWAPDRPQIAYVSDEREWNLIAVINGENGSGWTLAGEQGDKADPHWDATGKKVCYTRSQGTITACCVKGTSAATPVVLDPGEGVAAAPRWLPDDRVVYRFSDPRRAPVLIVQEAKADGICTRLPAPEPIAGAEPTQPLENASPEDETAAAQEEHAATEVTDVEPASDEAAEQPPHPELEGAIDGLIVPATHQVEIEEGITLSGLLYQRTERSGPAPGVLSLGEGPPHRHGAELHPTEQRLAAAGLLVYALNGRGSPGSGRAIAHGLRDATDPEIAVSDLVDVAASLRARDDVMADSLAVVGRGFGGTLALLSASRPGTFQAFVAIDPIVDWDRELDQAASAERRWIIENLGVPSIQRGRIATHSPMTYAGLLDGPVLLLGSEDAPPGRATQLDVLVAILDELGVSYQRQTIQPGEPEAETADRIASFLRGAFTVTREQTEAIALEPDGAHANGTVPDVDVAEDQVVASPGPEPDKLA
ncbi:MAG TPA: prolyl oligopeptidase family serine peptidase [Thermomicrobiales bacterium]|nr:prolyl oligopeptidase family serine peptidase [Thermomicrobiales bacterium]